MKNLLLLITWLTAGKYSLIYALKGTEYSLLFTLWVTYSIVGIWLLAGKLRK